MSFYKVKVARTVGDPWLCGERNVEKVEDKLYMIYDNMKQCVLRSKRNLRGGRWESTVLGEVLIKKRDDRGGADIFDRGIIRRSDGGGRFRRPVRRTKK